MKKTIFIAGVIILVAVGVYGAVSFSKMSNPESQKITIVSTLFPMYDFARHIGGDKVEVTLLLPPGVEAHAFEPKPSDIVKIGKADIFVYTGEFMEPWAHDIISGLSGKDIKIVDASRGIELMSEENEHEHDADTNHEEADHREERGHNHGGTDPHIWLDFANAKIMTDNIAKTLAEKDPANASFYQKNAEDYKEKLTQLDNSYKATMANCQGKTIVYGGHYAFGYMAKRYGLKYMSAQGFAPDSEPTANDLIALVEQIKKNNINYVFYEELSSPKIAKTLAKETNAKMLLLNGAHNLAKDDYNNKATYISLMESNLENLAIGLNCVK